MSFGKLISRIFTIIILFQFVGCSDPGFEFTPDLNSTMQKSDRLILGRELQDPYDIHNIDKAFSILKATRSSVPTEKIEPNHTYLRFLPENESEQELLKKDTSIILFDHPLNYEILGEQTTNPAISDSSLSWQYCVVPVDKVLPPVHYEIIYGVFIPPDNSSNTSDSLDEFYEDVVYESARFTGNLEDDDQSVYQSKKSFQFKWTPRGRIRAWDDLLGMYVPMKHVNVHARWFTHIESDLTDENGYFQMKSFRYKVNYSIKWENSLFTIRDGNFFQAWYNGPKKKGDWNLDIRGGKSIMFATIHRAAYKQFYGDNLGMFRPALLSGGRTKITYRDEDGTGKFLGDWGGAGIIPDIIIWGKSGGKYRTTDEVFGSTAHELGHQSHSLYLGNIKFWQTSNIIRESWAEAVEWALTNDEYNELGRKYGVNRAITYNHNSSKHNKWPFVDDPDYSPIFIDLVDEFNQRLTKGPEYPNDLISKYSISYINYNLLMNAANITSLRDEVSKHKLEGVDDFQIGELFSLY